MSKSVQTDINQWDTVKLADVTKTFEQWQRSGTIKNIISNLIKPEKKTITVLENISFEVKTGEFVAYAGPNGAGKSTTIKLICGMLVPVQGEIKVFGLSPIENRIKLMKRIGILFGNRTELWWDHPINTSFEWKRSVWNIQKERYISMRDMVVELLDISKLMNTFARELSLGQRMRCDLAMMLLHEPELILLDEPTLGLDVLAKRQMIGFLKQLNKEKNTTIIVTSHDMDDLEEMAERILLISHGAIDFDGSFNALRQYIGCKRQMVVTTQSKEVPIIAGVSYINSNDINHLYEFDTEQISMPQILKGLSILEGISDVRFEQTSLEEALANLFQKWNAE